jgi:hypothetical protein
MNVELPMCLADWIDSDNLSSWNVCQNHAEGMMRFLEANPGKIDWESLHHNKSSEWLLRFVENKQDKITTWNYEWKQKGNQRFKKSSLLLQKKNYYADNKKHPHICANELDDEAMQFLAENLDQINWRILSSNKSKGAMQLLTKNQNKIDWDWLCYNESEGAMHLLENNPNKINWGYLCWNESKYAIQLLTKNQDKICWNYLCMNKSEGAMQLLEKNQNKICWMYLSANTSDGALRILANNLDKIVWWSLSQNPAAMQLLFENQDKIKWANLSMNPAIFVYDYAAMRQNCLLFKEELMKDRFHPQNLTKFREWGTDGFDSDSDSD